MRISHEAIYQALYVQGRGALRRELTACLRTGRALRVPRARTRGRGKSFVTPEVLISERPAEAADRAVPGHWEGDLILGLGSSAIGTLVERTTRFTMLLHLPRMAGHGERTRVKNGPALAGHGAEAVRDAIARTITTLPEQLRRSLTWDQGAEMAQHARLRIDTGVQVYFCDPHSPWQRGTNENTNGLLRQYFPKGTDLSAHGADDLAAVAARPQHQAAQDSRLANTGRGARRGSTIGSTGSVATTAEARPPSSSVAQTDRSRWTSRRLVVARLERVILSAACGASPGGEDPRPLLRVLLSTRMVRIADQSCMRAGRREDRTSAGAHSARYPGARISRRSPAASRSPPPSVRRRARGCGRQPLDGLTLLHP